VFILDTNILSAMMRLQLEPPVATWISAQPAGMLFTTSLSQAEILSGLAILPDGRRRRDLEATARIMFMEDFDGRVLPFDMKAAAAYADIFASRRRAGRPAATVDLMIASVARSHGASVVTRDTGGFEECGVTLINPWDMRDTAVPART
jgi:predicted nucleic acid-binding protein